MESLALACVGLNPHTHNHTYIYMYHTLCYWHFQSPTKNIRNVECQKRGAVFCIKGEPCLEKIESYSTLLQDKRRWVMTFSEVCSCSCCCCCCCCSVLFHESLLSIWYLGFGDGCWLNLQNIWSRVGTGSQGNLSFFILIEDNWGSATDTFALLEELTTLNRT